MVDITGLMPLPMEVTGMKVKLLVWAPTTFQMADNTKGNGLKIVCMEWVF